MIRRLRVALILSVVLVLATALPALAAYQWCEGDPVLDIQGTRISVVTRVPVDKAGELKAPVEVKVWVPKNVQVSLVAVTGSYFQEEVTIRRTNQVWRAPDPVPVTVEVVARSKFSRPVPIQVEAFGGGVRGRKLQETGQSRADIQFQVIPTQR